MARNFTYAPIAEGGTFYSFTDAVNQLTKCLIEDQYTFAFTKFACFNLESKDFGEDGVPAWLAKVNGNSSSTTEFEAHTYQTLEGWAFDSFIDERKPMPIGLRDGLVYLGEIDTTNTVSLDANAYGEVYLTIPNDCGTNKNVIEKSAFVEPNHIDFGCVPNWNNINADKETSIINEPFSFNVVFVYAQTYKVYSGEPACNPFLYGVLFLDPTFESSFVKYTPHDKNLNGNSYGLKINIRLDAVEGAGNTKTVVRESTNDSMQIFGDAIAKLENIATTFRNQNYRETDLTKRVEDLEQLMYSVDDYNTLSARLEELRVSFENASAAMESSETIFNLIANLEHEIELLATGQLSSRLTLDLDVIASGNNIDVHKQDGYVKIDNTQKFWNTAKRITVWEDGTASIGIAVPNPSSFIWYSIEQGITLNSNLTIIVDSQDSWKPGYATRVCFDTLDCNGNDIMIVNENGEFIYQIDNSQLPSGVFGRVIIDMTMFDGVFFVDLVKGKN